MSNRGPSRPPRPRRRYRIPPRPAPNGGAGVDSLPYLSPEQLRDGPVDERWDVSSLGSVLYEMATGVRPFWGAAATALRTAVLEERPPDVTSLRRGLPRPLGALVARCMEKDPGRRVASAGDVRDALLAIERARAPVTA
jgi:eukaryotic-like serine/threonine-protein kinase